MKCSTCNKPVITDEEFVKFPCPKCLKTTIIRCKDCRRDSREYRCESCGFIGP